MKRKMGTFYAQCALENHSDSAKRRPDLRLLVDTGSENTWVRSETLRELGIVPMKRVSFLTADGRTLEREVGFAIVRVGPHLTIDEVVFAEPDDLQILGARSLEGLNLAVDPARKRLVVAGPLPAAALSC